MQQNVVEYTQPRVGNTPEFLSIFLRVFIYRSLYLSLSVSLCLPLPLHCILLATDQDVAFFLGTRFLATVNGSVLLKKPRVVRHFVVVSKYSSSVPSPVSIKSRTSSHIYKRRVSPTPILTTHDHPRIHLPTYIHPSVHPSVRPSIRHT